MLIAVTTRIQRASTVFGILDLLALAFLTVCLLGTVVWAAVPAARPTLRRLASPIRHWGLWAGFAVAAVCTAGSLWLSEVGHLSPCRFCWFQRICMYPLTVVLGIGAARRDKGVVWYAGPLALVGAGLSTYHYLLEWFPSLESGSGCDPLNPCTVVIFRRFGFASIPFMALTGFVTIIVLVLFSASAARPATSPSALESP